jgi:hypothetical protein
MELVNIKFKVSSRLVRSSSSRNLSNSFWYASDNHLSAFVAGNKRYARNSSSTQGRIFELRPPDSPLSLPLTICST